jgi:hypothetical protein
MVCCFRSYFVVARRPNQSFMFGLVHQWPSSKRPDLGPVPPITGIQVTGGGMATNTFGFRVTISGVLVRELNGFPGIGYKLLEAGIGWKVIGHSFH